MTTKAIAKTLNTLTNRDFAQAKWREAWLHHPVIGDPSWDAFQREPGNPIHAGKPPFAWPVNGFLFFDPPSKNWLSFISIYPNGYWGSPPANILPMREKKGGGWETLTPLFGDKDRPPFVGEGGLMTDASIVYDAGRYHLVYGWADRNNDNGGLAYAWATKPEGPYHVAQTPLAEQKTFDSKPISGRYVRPYASTLIKRKNDWLILHMMSTAKNAGGTWGLFAMTAPRPEGPYSAPIPLLLPQSDIFHPMLAEFYPQFVHDGWIYAPASSVALNRTFQTLFRAPLERAQEKSAWEIVQSGSLWHAETVPSEAQGLWGQTFSGQVQNGELRALFPTKNGADSGQIGIARRPWKTLNRDGFVLSAPKAPAIGVLNGNWGDFSLETTLESQDFGGQSASFSLCWAVSAPLGLDEPRADSMRHALMARDRCEFRRGREEWSVVAIAPDGTLRTLGGGRIAVAPGAQRVNIARNGAKVTI